MTHTTLHCPCFARLPRSRTFARPHFLILLLLAVALTPLAASSGTPGDFTGYADVVNNIATITGYTGPGGSISIPTSFQGCPVTRIESTAFKGCNSITAVTIPDCVTNFGSSAFQD